MIWLVSAVCVAAPAPAVHSRSTVPATAVVYWTSCASNEASRVAAVEGADLALHLLQGDVLP